MSPVLLFLGDLDEPHGVDLLLRAMPAVRRSHPPARLVVIGDGPLREALAAYCRYLQIQDDVDFLPWQPVPYYADVIRGADLVVVPGRRAVSPEAILAGWWAGKPVVATHEAASGLAEHDADALLVYASETAVASAVVRILGDGSLARRLGEAGHRKWRDGFAGQSPPPPAGRGGPESRS